MGCLKLHIENEPTLRVAYSQKEQKPLKNGCDYYPFGLLQKGYNTDVSSNGNNEAQKIKYQGQELEEEHGKNTYAYQWRDYDPALGRFGKVDRFAEQYYEDTPYHFTKNSPILYREVAGDSITTTVYTRGANNQAVAENLYWGQDSNGNYAFINQSTGNVYSGNNQFVQDLTAGLNDLMNGGQVGNDLVTSLASDQNNSVTINKSRRNSADFNGAYVTWNPSSTNGGPDGANNQRPSFISLGHELAHIEDAWNGGVDTSSWFTITNTAGNNQSIPKAEIYATHVENQIRAENNLPLRISYSADSNGNPAGQRIIFRNTRQSRYYDSNGNNNQNYRTINRRKQTPFSY